MKTFLLLLILGAILYFGYQRMHDYGLPWQEQVTLVRYEHSKRYRGGGEQVYVHGEVQNRTRKRVEAEVECKTLPEGMTLTPKGWTAVTMQPLETVPFDVALTTRREVRGAQCKVRRWQAEGGLEEKVAGTVQQLLARLRRLF